MATDIKTNWMQDFNGALFAPKTLVESIQNKEGTPLEKLLGQGGGDNSSVKIKSYKYTGTGSFGRDGGVRLTFEKPCLFCSVSGEESPSFYVNILFTSEQTYATGANGNNSAYAAANTLEWNEDKTECYMYNTLNAGSNYNYAGVEYTVSYLYIENNLSSPIILMDNIQDNDGTTLKDYINKTISDYISGSVTE